MNVSAAVLTLCAVLCSVAAQAPVVSVEPQSATVRQGGSFSFKCQVSSGAQPVLEWRRDNNQPLPENVKTESGGSVLTVANSQPGNQGQYRCIASNSAGRSSAAAVLNVKFAPKVQLTPAGPLRVRMGEAVSVECRATGWPNVSLSWKRQGSTQQLLTREMDDANVLQWPAIHPANSGVYICQGKNSEGMMEVKVEIFVEGPPYTTCVPKQVALQAGDALRVQCLAQGTRPFRFEWSRVGRASLPPGVEVTKDGKLFIAQVKASDSGTYKCVATNHIGSSDAVANVTVRA